ncbi:restriction endonuclease subunit S [Pseudomonas sp. N040]|uniref:restriction endonuclease subunit S n=1 Tax=Pseudomonas sp. N040 TaxID=2785325 RepID=UPI0035BE2D6E
MGGATPKREVPEYWDSPDVPWVTPKDVSDLAYPALEDAPEYISEAGFQSCSTSMLPKGSVLVTSRAPIGNIAIAGRDLCTNQGFKSLVPGANVDGLYLYYCMKHSSERLQALGNGATFKEVSKKIVEEFEIPLPPLPEQKRIAAILDKADAIRRKRQQAIQLADNFLRAVFLDMFGDPVTNPKGWEVRPLSVLVSKLGDGLHGTPEYDESGDYYFINGNNLDNGSIVIGERVKRVGDEEFKKHKKELSQNTMLVSINGTIGKVAFYQGEKVVLGKSVCYFNVIPERISSMYLYHLIGSHYFLRYTSGIETGSTIKNVSLKSMRELPVPLPSAELQGSFKSLVKRIESKKAKLSASHNSASALFDSLSQNAFSGRV